MEIRDAEGLILYQSVARSNNVFISNMELRKAHLYQRDLHGISFYNCVFYGGDMDEANLEHAQLENVIFEGCMMCDINFRSAIFINVEFYDVILFRSDFSLSKWTRSRFYGVDLKETQFIESTLVDVSFLKDKITHKTDICSANFAMATLEKVTFEDIVYDNHTILPSDWCLTR